ncbi:hypothetical protein [Rheinheimera pleomorphica]|uniref:hypothetical protein n=1 Tax=Rheinheimera pleomorphica TaxID=2703963 RepID=UPI00141EC116|nr:hypothetical protein [Rheinheimera pleomorphica]
MKNITDIAPLLAVLLLSGCVTHYEAPQQKGQPAMQPEVPQSAQQETVKPKVVSSTVYTGVPYTPKLWSGHKILTLSAEQCATKGKAVLETLQFGAVVQNGHYVYGNYLQNRAVIKCVALESGSFVYVAVAGKQKAAVETLRNEIVWQF